MLVAAPDVEEGLVVVVVEAVDVELPDSVERILSQSIDGQSQT